MGKVLQGCTRDDVHKVFMEAIYKRGDTVKLNQVLTMIMKQAEEGNPSCYYPSAFRSEWVTRTLEDMGYEVEFVPASDVVYIYWV